MHKVSFSFQIYAVSIDPECQVCIYDLHLLQWQQIAMLDCTYCALQKDGPDADDPPDDTVPDEDDLDDCPLPDGGQVDQQTAQAELEIQKQIERRFVTVAW